MMEEKKRYYYSVKKTNILQLQCKSKDALHAEVHRALRLVSFVEVL